MKKVKNPMRVRGTDYLGVTLMSLTDCITGSPALVVIWVVVAYLFYDVGASFYSPNLIYRTLTLDSNKRGKLMIAPRMMNMVMGMITGSLINIVNGVNAGIGNLHTSFGVVVIAAAVVTGVISLVGICLVREKHHAEHEKDGAKVKFTDIFVMFKENDALRIKFCATIFGGFIWTFLMTTMMYYVKWAYCVDPVTGAVNAASYGTLSLIASMMMMLPLLLGTVLAMPLMKLFKTPVRTYRFVIIMEAVPCGMMFVLHMLGILQNSSTLMLALVAVSATAIGIGYIPQEAINIEIMDYQIFKTGKDRSAQVNATSKFLDKTQNALSSGLLGVILVSFGYVVNSATGDFVGELANLPRILNGFAIAMGLLPFLMGIIALILYRKYPITPEMAAEMKNALDEHHGVQKAE